MSQYTTDIPRRQKKLYGPVMTDEMYQRYLDGLERHPALVADNVNLPGATAARWVRPLLIAGAVLLVATFLGIFINGGLAGAPAVGLRHAVAAYSVGAFFVLSCCLGSLFFLMLFQLLNAHWSVTLRRVMEAVAAQMPFAVALLIPMLAVELLFDGVLLSWIGAEPNHLLEVKAPYLNIGFFIVRFLIYAACWLYLSARLVALSREQDTTGDRMLTRQMRRTSGWGMLVFALTVAFAGFDYLMSMDYRFFSTMWGVYFFSICALAALSLTAVLAGALRIVGRLNGLVTAEHFHDLGKLVFAFVVFWAYIAFSQYFLIWYSNIPEETAYYLYRKSGGWQVLSALLVVGHFIVPFFLLVTRLTKRSTLALMAISVWILFFCVLDFVWIIRPMVHAGLAPQDVPGPASWWLDVVAVAGLVALFLGLVVRRLAAAPLIPMKDPRLAKALAHDNFV